MPEVHEAIPGHFCWIELATPDPAAAKDFYAGVFDWTANENDMGAMGTYTIFQKNGRDAAAMYRQMPEQQQQGIPPNWATYIGVASADEAVAKATALGAAPIAPPFDVYDFGRMAVLQDPQGAVFCIWEAKKNIGVTIRDEWNTLCWNELATNDGQASLDFYSRLFGWTGKVSPDYIELESGGKPIGGMRTIGPGEMAPPNWMPYFSVSDCNAVTADVERRGGRAYVPPTDIPNVGRFAVVADPQGAVFAIITLP